MTYFKVSNNRTASKKRNGKGWKSPFSYDFQIRTRQFKAVGTIFKTFMHQFERYTC